MRGGSRLRMQISDRLSAGGPSIPHDGHDKVVANIASLWLRPTKQAGPGCSVLVVIFLPLSRRAATMAFHARIDFNSIHAARLLCCVDHIVIDCVEIRQRHRLR